MLFLIVRLRRFGTLNAMQKTKALYKAPFLKKSRKTARNCPLLTQKCFFDQFRQFFPIFSRAVLCRGLRFFVCVQQPIKDLTARGWSISATLQQAVTYLTARGWSSSARLKSAVIDLTANGWSSSARLQQAVTDFTARGWILSTG